MMPPDFPWPQVTSALGALILFFTAGNWVYRILRPFVRNPTDRTLAEGQQQIEASRVLIDGMQAQFTLIASDRSADRQRINSLESMLDGDRTKLAASFQALQADLSRVTAERDALSQQLAAERALRRDPASTGEV